MTTEVVFSGGDYWVCGLFPVAAADTELSANAGQRDLGAGVIWGREHGHVAHVSGIVAVARRL
jgi:hypothetical protein